MLKEIRSKLKLAFINSSVSLHRILDFVFKYIFFVYSSF